MSPWPRMDEDSDLFDKIKQKEQDFIRTLKDIAEAAFITDSLEATSNTDMDDNQVDSDLSQVAREIAKSSQNMLDDNSDADFEDIIDEAVEKKNIFPVANGKGITKEQTEYMTNNSQTVIKCDVMDAINDQIDVMLNGVDQTNESTKVVEEEVLNGTGEQQSEHQYESDDVQEKAESSWKIDYIRVETEQKKQKKNFKRNEIWRTNKSKKEKSKKNIKSCDKDCRRAKKKQTKMKNDALMAFKFDKNLKIKLNKPVLSANQKNKQRVRKEINNWRDVIKVRESSNINNDLHQISHDVLDPYKPTVPRGTSIDCINSLKDSDLEMLPCPGCQDHFLLPTTFFQHIHRKSVQIYFDCKYCKDTLIFQNKCLLKIHILTHLETLNIEEFETNHLNVLSLSDENLKHQSNVENFYKEIKSGNSSNDTCPECFHSLEQGELQSHFQTMSNSKSIFNCSICQEALPTKCSLIAHEKFHKRIPPYVCPECGSCFFTWKYFQEHVENVCFHQRRLLMNYCTLCPKDNKFTADKQEARRIFLNKLHF